MEQIKREKAKDLRISKTDQAITHAFARLLRQKSIDKITVTELCRLAKINRKTFYTHFYTIEDVLSFILESIRAHYYQIQIAHHADGAYDLTAAVHQMFAEIEAELPYLQDLASGTEYNRILLYCIQMSIDIRMEFIGEEQAAEPVVQRIQHFMNSGFVATIMDWLRSHDGMSSKELADISVDLFLSTRNKYHMGNMKKYDL